MGDVDKLQEAEEWAGQREHDQKTEAAEKRAAELAEEPIEQTATRQRTVKLIELAKIADRDGVRLDLPRVHELALSLRQRGLARAITVRTDEDSDDYVVVVGHRQLAALRELHGEDQSIQVPCMVIEGLTEAEVFALILTENEQREALEPLQAARAARHLLDLSPEMTAADLSRSLGLKEKWLKDRFKLLDLPPSVQQLMEKGDLSFTVANMLRAAQEKGKIDEMEATHLADQIASGERTYTAVKAEIAPTKKREPATPPPTTVRVGDAGEIVSFAGGGDTPFDGNGRATPDTWDRTIFEAEEQRAASARAEYLTDQADRLLREAPISMTGSLPTQRAAGDQIVDTVARDEDDMAAGDIAADQSSDPGGPNITAVRDQLHALMVGRMLEDWADDDYLVELGIDRDGAMDYARQQAYPKRVHLFYSIAAHMGNGQMQR
jgi:ParB/RepB/Spo0J family partition protein